MHTFVGLWIILKYLEHRQKVLLQIGVGWIGAATVWMGVAIDFIFILITDAPTPIEVHLLIIGGVLPFTQLAWVAGITALMPIEESTRKKILLIGTIVALIFCPLYIYLTLTDPLIWGSKITPIQVKLSFYNQIHYAVEIVVFILPGLWFSRESLKSDKPEINLKGKFLLFTFIVSILMTLLELLSATVLVYLIARIIAVFVAVSFYIGFIMPNWAKNLFLKNNA
jgi:hypothetical protein